MAFEAGGRTVVAAERIPRGEPQPRKPRRRRISRRRFYRRVIGTLVVAAVLIVATGPTLRYLGYLPRHRGQVTMRWDLVQLSPDRRSVEIRVDQCGAEYNGTKVKRVGVNVRLTVSVYNDVDGKLACVPFDRMPAHVVHFGFTLPADGRVLPSGCPKAACADPGAS